MSYIPVGKCSLCGGLVTVPTVWFGTMPPTPQCQSCRALKDMAENLPVVPMRLDLTTVYGPGAVPPDCWKQPKRTTH